MVIVEAIYDFVKLGAERVELLGIGQTLLLLLQVVLLRRLGLVALVGSLLTVLGVLHRCGLGLLLGNLLRHMLRYSLRGKSVQLGELLLLLRLQVRLLLAREIRVQILVEVLLRQRRRLQSLRCLQGVVIRRLWHKATRPS